jgi:hypothetical protein
MWKPKNMGKKNSDCERLKRGGRWMDKWRLDLISICCVQVLKCDTEPIGSPICILIKITFKLKIFLKENTDN